MLTLVRRFPAGFASQRTLGVLRDRAAEIFRKHGVLEITERFDPSGGRADRRVEMDLDTDPTGVLLRDLDGVREWSIERSLAVAERIKAHDPEFRNDTVAQHFRQVRLTFAVPRDGARFRIRMAGADEDLFHAERVFGLKGLFLRGWLKGLLHRSLGLAASPFGQSRFRDDRVSVMNMLSESFCRFHIG
jgi:hypothetical protein